MQTKIGVKSNTGFKFEAERHPDGGVIVSAESPHGDTICTVLSDLEAEDFVTAIQAAQNQKN